MSDRPYVPCILNPTAGRGRAAAAWPAVRAELEQGGADWTLLETHAAGDARELAAGAGARRPSSWSGATGPSTKR